MASDSEDEWADFDSSQMQETHLKTYNDVTINVQQTQHVSQDKKNDMIDSFDQPSDQIDFKADFSFDNEIIKESEVILNHVDNFSNGEIDFEEKQIITDVKLNLPETINEEFKNFDTNRSTDNFVAFDSTNVDDFGDFDKPSTSDDFGAFDSHHDSHHDSQHDNTTFEASAAEDCDKDEFDDFADFSSPVDASELPDISKSPEAETLSQAETNDTLHDEDDDFGDFDDASHHETIEVSPKTVVASPKTNISLTEKISIVLESVFSAQLVSYESYSNTEAFSNQQLSDVISVRTTFPWSQLCQVSDTLAFEFRFAHSTLEEVLLSSLALDRRHLVAKYAIPVFAQGLTSGPTVLQPERPTEPSKTSVPSANTNISNNLVTTPPDENTADPDSRIPESDADETPATPTNSRMNDLTDLTNEESTIEAASKKQRASADFDWRAAGLSDPLATEPGRFDLDFFVTHSSLSGNAQTSANRADEYDEFLTPAAPPPSSAEKSSSAILENLLKNSQLTIVPPVSEETEPTDKQYSLQAKLLLESLPDLSYMLAASAIPPERKKEDFNQHFS